jgi:hypothetical protein
LFDLEFDGVAPFKTEESLMKTPAAADAVAAEPIPAGERADGALVDGAELETAGRLDALDAERDPAAEGRP